MMSNESILQDDLAELCRLVGVSDCPQPKSPHEVFQECLAKARTLLDRHWQPIETAPKDGSKVLTYTPKGCYQGIHSNRWSGTQWYADNTIDQPSLWMSVPDPVPVRCDSCNGDGKREVAAPQPNDPEYAREVACDACNGHGWL